MITIPFTGYRIHDDGCECDTCHKGHIDENVFDPECLVCMEEKCMICNGTGRLKNDDECEVCGLTGRIDSTGAHKGVGNV